MSDPTPVHCHLCGREEGDPTRLLTWTTAVEQGATRHFCDACSREHLRSMEAKLDSQWW